MTKIKVHKKVIVLSVIAVLLINLPVIIKTIFLTSDVENVSYTYSGGLPIQWYREGVVRVCYDGCFNIVQKQANLLLLGVNILLTCTVVLILFRTWTKFRNKDVKFEAEITQETMNKERSKTEITSLRVMADYASSGIWVMEQTGPFRHGMIEYSELGISQELSNDFGNWIIGYDRALEGKLDVDKFDKTGMSLAIRLKQELPDVKVFYWHENRELGEEEVFDKLSI